LKLGERARSGEREIKKGSSWWKKRGDWSRGGWDGVCFSIFNI